MFGATSIVRNSDQERWLYSGYGIASVGKSMWNFGNDVTSNVVVHHLILTIVRITVEYYLKDQLMVLIEAFMHQIKCLTLIRKRRTFAWIYITMVIIVVCLLTEENSSKGKCQVSNSVLSRNHI